MMKALYIDYELSMDKTTIY